MSFTQRIAGFAGVPTPMPVREVLQVIDEDIARGPGQEAPGLAVQAMREHTELWKGATRQAFKNAGTLAVSAVGATLDFVMEGPRIVRGHPLQRLGDISLGALSQAMDFVFGPEDPQLRGKIGQHD